MRMTYVLSQYVAEAADRLFLLLPLAQAGRE